MVDSLDTRDAGLAREQLSDALARLSVSYLVRQIRLVRYLLEVRELEVLESLIHDFTRVACFVIFILDVLLDLLNHELLLRSNVRFHHARYGVSWLVRNRVY